MALLTSLESLRGAVFLGTPTNTSRAVINLTERSSFGSPSAPCVSLIVGLNMSERRVRRRYGEQPGERPGRGPAEAAAPYPELDGASPHHHHHCMKPFPVYGVIKVTSSEF